MLHPLLFVVVIFLIAHSAPETNPVLHLKVHGHKYTNKMRLTYIYKAADSDAGEIANIGLAVCSGMCLELFSP